MHHITYLIILLVIFIAGCGVTPQAASTYQASFNFGAVSSYSTFSRDSEFTSVQNISDVTRNSIELSIERALDDLGLRFQGQDAADVTITYYLITTKSSGLAAYNKRVKYCRGCLHSAESREGKKHWKFYPGSLILDVVNNDNQQSVWRSVYPLGIDNRDNSSDAQLKINAAINTMLAAMPSDFVNTSVNP